MPLSTEFIREVLYPKRDGSGRSRFTQDSPILPDVWVTFGERPGERRELLLTPHADSSVQALVVALRQRLVQDQAALPEIRLMYNESHVLANLTFRDLIRDALPLSDWWRRHIAGSMLSESAYLRELAVQPDLVSLLFEPMHPGKSVPLNEDLLQLARMAGACALGRGPEDGNSRNPEYWRQAVHELSILLENLPPVEIKDPVPPLFSVSPNRQATPAVWRSRLAVKGDAAVRLFRIRCQEIRWAIVDSGVDARHPAFRRARTEEGAAAGGADCPPSDGTFDSRVMKTYDFTRLRSILDPYAPVEPEPRGGTGLDGLDPKYRTRIQRDLRRRLLTGQTVDWNLLEPFLRMPHDANYREPENAHGTHVAGILGACWDELAKEESGPPDIFSRELSNEQALIGICPDIGMYDLRVFGGDGRSDEFTVLAALQFIRHLNLNKDVMVIHGVNLSMSLVHDVRNYACGRTPVCEEAERLVGSGVVVVAAAGNRGYTENYNAMSITDPGNAEGVITVGATHRHMPHTYGVSYFSSRGPTGDGRLKPDLVAPGEKIKSVVPLKQTATMDGTSMAAPHVSGAAALLMGRNRELIGQPARIKKILCSTATDLGRERAFQGAGMLDALRALQSV